MSCLSFYISDHFVLNLLGIRVSYHVYSPTSLLAAFMSLFLQFNLLNGGIVKKTTVLLRKLCSCQFLILCRSMQKTVFILFQKMEFVRYAKGLRFFKLVILY